MNSCDYTRPYFAWPNSFFAELIDKLMSTGELPSNRFIIVCHTFFCPMY